MVWNSGVIVVPDMWLIRVMDTLSLLRLLLSHEYCMPLTDSKY